MGVGAPSMVWGLPEHCARLPELFSLRGWGEDPGLLLSPGEAGATQQHKLCIFSPCCTRVGEPQAPPSPLLSPKAPSSPQVQPGLPRAVVMLGWGFPPGCGHPYIWGAAPLEPPTCHSWVQRGAACTRRAGLLLFAAACWRASR